MRYQQSVFRRCNRWWWSELLYLHNFMPFDSDKVCMVSFCSSDESFFLLGNLCCQFIESGDAMF